MRRAAAAVSLKGVLIYFNFLMDFLQTFLAEVKQNSLLF